MKIARETEIKWDLSIETNVVLAEHQEELSLRIWFKRAPNDGTDTVHFMLNGEEVHKLAKAFAKFAADYDEAMGG